MAITYDDLHGTFEQRKKAISQFNLMDDTFMSAVLEHKDACEYLLSALLDTKITVRSNKTQYSIRNINDRSVVLDVFAEDDKGRLMNIEIQMNDKHDHQKRIRFHQAMIDCSALDKGTDFSRLPDLYLIFISSFDPFNMDKNHYEVEQYLKDPPVKYENGVHIHYFNTAVDDGSKLSALLQYLAKSDPSVRDFGALSQRVNYHKDVQKGVDSMCQLVEDYVKQNSKIYIEQAKTEGRAEGKAEGRAEGKAEGRAEGRIENAVETVIKMLKKDIPLETALECAGIDKATYEKYAAKMK